MTKYKLVYSEYTKELDEDVNKHLDEGWKLYGNAFGVGGPKYWFVCQAMIIEEVEEIPAMKGTREALDKIVI